jgi:hypothetical protein
MTTQDIKQSELTPSERDVLEADRKRWHRMGSGGHLDDWLAYGPGLMIRRRLAMRIAFVNRPEGKGYNLVFGQLLKDDGLDTMESQTISHILWFHDDAERLNILREIRDAMTPGMRSRLNTPKAARDRVIAVLNARQGGTEEKLKHSPVTIYKQQLAEAARKIAHLEERLAAAEAGSLFDIKRDSAEDIGSVMAAHMSESRFDTAVKAAKAAYRRKQKPAG